MTVDEFVAKWTGVYCKSPLGLGGQCVDLANTYCLEVLGVPELQANAADWWTQYDTSKFDAIANVSEEINPAKGDIIIWSTKFDPYGHIAICIETIGNTQFNSFDQNDPLTSLPHIQNHSYVDIPGWLRHKAVQPAPTPTPPAGGDVMTPDQTNALQVLTEAQSTYSQGNLESTARYLVGQTQQVQSDTNTIENLQTSNNLLTNQNQSLVDSLKSEKDTNTSLAGELNICQNQQKPLQQASSTQLFQQLLLNLFGKK